MTKRIGIVYFVYINPKKDWKKIISGQLNDMKNSGILDEADVYIEVNNSNAASDVKEFFSLLDYSIKNVEYHQDNTFEYYGIHKLWSLSHEDKYEYLIYLHTKGMSYRNKFFNLVKGRNIRELILTYYTFKDYKHTLSVLDSNQEIIRAGIMPRCDDDSFYKTGCFIWFNFYWIRSSYVKTLEEPVITDDRYYYEAWAAKTEGEHGDAYKRLTYCLYRKDHSAFTIHEASDELKRLRKKYKYTWPFSAIKRKRTLQGH